jgi:uncharacterized protein YciI
MQLGAGPVGRGKLALRPESRVVSWAAAVRARPHRWRGGAGSAAPLERWSGLGRTAGEVGRQLVRKEVRVADITPYYVVEADYVEDATEKRRPYRQEHLERIRKLGSEGAVTLAGGFEDMRTSLLVFDLESEQSVAAVIESDVYWREGIWTGYRIRKLNAVSLG